MIIRASVILKKIKFHFLRALIVNVHNDVCVTEAGGILIWYKRSLDYEDLERLQILIERGEV